MACFTDNPASWKMRACNSVIRNQNHILKCTLKTLLDNPLRTRDRALSSLIGLCRKQCNGPIIELPPKRSFSLPTVSVLPVHYVPVCPPPIIIRSKKTEEVQEEEKPAAVVRKRKVRKACCEPKSCSKNLCETLNNMQSICSCCGRSVSPRFKCPSPKIFSKKPTSPCNFGASNFISMDCGSQRRETKAKTDKCSRRCCLSKNPSMATPLTMSPLCCPPSVKSLSPKTKDKGKCTPIVKSYKRAPAPTGHSRQEQETCSPSRNRSAPNFRFPESCAGFMNDSCKNNMGYSYNNFYSNFCKNNNDSEVDPPGMYTPRSAFQETLETKDSSMFMPSTSGASPISLSTQRHGNLSKTTSQIQSLYGTYTNPTTRQSKTLFGAYAKPTGQIKKSDGDNTKGGLIVKRAYGGSTTDTSQVNKRLYGYKANLANQEKRSPAQSGYSSPTLRSAMEDPFSVTTWKTSIPIRFSDLPKRYRN
ncbi:hypothetical protein EGW08_000029 [Elysia chlorotica]|uniref:Uncharacterized protein n=1 Tax=Elysia chlorotica TaxID=188477 RepID=A0A3S5K2K8_ELYCH|nr:hypothetical protein EGW08_000029 [Elysia chlorotica]